MFVAPWLALAVAAEPAEEEPAPQLPAILDGTSVGLTQLATAGEQAGGHQFGLAVATRRSMTLADGFALNLVGSAGLTQPKNTVAVASFAIDAGKWSVKGFRDVSAWVEAGQGTDMQGFRSLGATFAYVGLGASLLAVPVLLAVSPAASLGHAVAGPTVSWQSGEAMPNILIEAGVGGTIYLDPADGLPALAAGPMVGVGTELEGHLVVLDVLICPPGAVANGREARELLVTSQVVVGF